MTGLLPCRGDARHRGFMVRRHPLDLFARVRGLGLGTTVTWGLAPARRDPDEPSASVRHRDFLSVRRTVAGLAAQSL